ncbi:TetR/AcrR family transcriptional regulator [Paucilactobacillus suebicus]|uniref:Transcriptional regulator n=1 Tax=Paucilactobacillus suebicus DSM 5007 = KCTC 3549 TaxID=1423807 RepID=A0A0R1W2D5_9LACO|nr:TetR/AcrR family transcriptional regulator [Paucilactobacillus suebicus]KRM11679.1 transcriptional regulator [Paucilactobacillus suebicus DSM 5007 = KCTC 3549]
MANNNTTEERLLTAFSDLVLKYGYRGTTTKKIADVAGVNESTIFRHFKDKHGILNELVNKYLQDADQAANDFKPIGDIELDLIQGAKIYETFTTTHRSVFLIGLRESYQFPEIADAVRQLQQRFKKILVDKFTEMAESGEISSTVDIKNETDNFVLMIFGNVVLSFAYTDAELYIPSNQFLENNVRLFASHLK